MSRSLMDDPLAWATIASAAVAAMILLWFLLRRPALVRSTKVLLLLGVGVFPIASAGTGNLVGLERSKGRVFCSSCHVMEAHTGDSSNPRSTTLAALHGRNEWFGAENCYVCHSDYGMFGTVTTKLNGLRHVYEYYGGFRSMTLEEALPKIHLYRPYPNANCMHCHSTTLPQWNEVPDHRGLAADLRSGRVSCASEGCHGPAHPFSKPEAP